MTRERVADALFSFFFSSDKEVDAFKLVCYLSERQHQQQL